MKMLSCAWLKGIMLLILMSGASVFGLTPQEYQPVFKPSLTIQKTTNKVDIDGNLTESIWENAQVIENFVERSPGDNVQPKVKTYAMITYDEDHLYVAFKCFDDPTQIRATMCQRDQFTANDAVSIHLDTYGDATWAYEFLVNPYGIQKDFLWTNTVGEDSGFDLIWESAGKITSEGYQVEIAIPFSSLRLTSIHGPRMTAMNNAGPANGVR